MKYLPNNLSQSEKTILIFMAGMFALVACLVFAILGYAWLSPPPVPEPPAALPAQQLAPPDPTSTPSDTPTPYPTNTQTLTATPVVQPTFTRTPTAAISLPTSTALPVVLPTATLLPAPTQVQAVCDCGGDFYNCDDFTSWDQAQQCFEYCRAQERGDVHGLDGNNNFIVCESDR